MKKGLIGKKLGMTHFFSEKGEFVPVTVIECGPCTVVTAKTAAKDGYSALLLGFGSARRRMSTSPSSETSSPPDWTPIRPPS